MGFEVCGVDLRSGGTWFGSGWNLDSDIKVKTVAYWHEWMLTTDDTESIARCRLKKPSALPGLVR